MRAEPEDVLRRLAAGDEQLLGAVLAPTARVRTTRS